MKRWIASLRDAVVFLVLYAVAQYVCIFLAGIISVDDPAPTVVPGQRIAVVSACGSLLAVAAVAVYRRIVYGRGCAMMHSKQGFDPRVLLWGVVLLAAVSIVIDPMLSHLPVADQNYGRGGWTLLSVVIVAPVAEELLFRGLLLEMFRRHMGTVAAVVLSSVVFALMHMQPAVMIDAFLAALVLCYIYLLTRSIYACILLHIFNNAIAMSMQVLEYHDKTLAEIVDSSSVYFIVYAAALAVVAVGAMHAARTIGHAGGKVKNSAVR
ncbi:MAG: CPBP family intramembrane metalloprotease [Alistipes sp.]|nr:CPBP family intramembrane metalloprotease [Alistipes sp.]MDE7128862.1 CPBP family intramembrane metalloprotease [Alistipes sp.]